jgi:hypothetical protein
MTEFERERMISSHDRSKLPARCWVFLHRAAGYGFIALFAVFSYFMLLRIKGSPDELSPRIILHMVLAFSLAPLLLEYWTTISNYKGSSYPALVGT